MLLEILPILMLALIVSCGRWPSLCFLGCYWMFGILEVLYCMLLDESYCKNNEKEQLNALGIDKLCNNTLQLTLLYSVCELQCLADIAVVLWSPCQDVVRTVLMHSECCNWIVHHEFVWGACWAAWALDAERHSTIMGVPRMVCLWKACIGHQFSIFLLFLNNCDFFKELFSESGIIHQNMCWCFSVRKIHIGCPFSLVAKSA